MKRFELLLLLKKLMLILVPFLIVLCIDIFVLPINWPTFRMWETVLSKHIPLFSYQGPFYPNVSMRMREVGDLAAHTEFAVYKDVYWETDKYGFRKKNSNINKINIVVVGDSMIGGSGLSQSEMFSEVLGEKLKVSVYPYAPAKINQFLNDERFIQKPPDIVIVSSVERFLKNLEMPKKNANADGIKSKIMAYINNIKGHRHMMPLIIVANRCFKMNLFNSIRSRLNYSGMRGTCGSNGKMMFLNINAPRQYISNDQFNMMVETIVAYKTAIESRGIKFIFMPIPNKETVYHNLLPSKMKTYFYRRFINALKEKGITVIDLETIYNDILNENGPLLFHLDDSHWNSEGARVAADAAANCIRMENNGNEKRN